jgi:hypothetical protein
MAKNSEIKVKRLKEGGWKIITNFFNFTAKSDESAISNFEALEQESHSIPEYGNSMRIAYSKFKELLKK